VYWATGAITSYVYTFQFINDSYANDVYNQINEYNIMSNGGTTNKNQYSLSFSVNSNTQINYISILLGTYNISYGTFNTGQVNFSLAISGNGINVNLGDYSINSNELDNNFYEMILSILFNPISLNSGNYNLIISGIDNSIYNLSLAYNTTTNDYIYEIGYYQVNTQNISFY
ncbi:MAG: hypothetical protein ACP5L4_07385, partial [Thermoplasmata archaeon]